MPGRGGNPGALVGDEKLDAGALARRADVALALSNSVMREIAGPPLPVPPLASSCGFGGEGRAVMSFFQLSTARRKKEENSEFPAETGGLFGTGTDPDPTKPIL